MRHIAAIAAVVIAWAGVAPPAQPAGQGPYRILKTARVGGEGGWDYIYADSAGRRLYIPRRGAPPVVTRLMVFNLDTLEPVGEVEGIGGSGVAVDPA